MTYFTNKLKGREREKGISTRMRVKLAAKMLVIAWALMKKRQALQIQDRTELPPAMSRGSD